jgi:hypothetical protein
MKVFTAPMAATTIAFFGLIGYVVRSATIVWTRWIDARRAENAPLAAGDAERRLARIEQAVEAIAVEVERVAESQRFAARLARERIEAPGAQRFGGHVTPH